VPKTPKKAARPTTSADSVDLRATALVRAFKRDPALAQIADAYEKQPAERGRKFGSNGLKTKRGKLFALFTQSTLVVKLPKERVAALVAAGVGKPFDPGHGRPMKEWLTVTSPKASWFDLAKEAHAYVEA
jgi:hypothetical protein